MTEPWVSADVIAKPVGATKGSVYARSFRDFGVDEWVRREDVEDRARISRKQGL